VGLSEQKLFQEMSKQRRLILPYERGKKLDKLSNIFLKYILSELSMGKSALMKGLEPAESSIKK